MPNFRQFKNITLRDDISDDNLLNIEMDTPIFVNRKVYNYKQVLESIIATYDPRTVRLFRAYMREMGNPYTSARFATVRRERVSQWKSRGEDIIAFCPEGIVDLSGDTPFAMSSDTQWAKTINNRDAAFFLRNFRATSQFLAVKL